MIHDCGEMVRQASKGKAPDDYLLTPADGKRVKDFRKTWQNLAIKAGLGRMICEDCKESVATGKKCKRCGSKRVRYAGPLLHDFRRSAARELRYAGVSESTIMAIGGWKTAAMFQR